MRLRFRETDREGGSVTEPDRERDTRLSHRHIKAREFETGTQRERARGTRPSKRQARAGGHKNSIRVALWH